MYAEYEYLIHFLLQRRRREGPFPKEDYRCRDIYLTLSAALLRVDARGSATTLRLLVVIFDSTSDVDELSATNKYITYCSVNIKNSSL